MQEVSISKSFILVIVLIKLKSYNPYKSINKRRARGLVR